MSEENNEKVRATSNQAMMLLLALYEAIKADGHGERFGAVVIDVSSEDAKACYLKRANEYRQLVIELRTKGLPAENRVKPGEQYRGPDLTEIQASAINAKAEEQAIKAMERAAEALEWMASRVAKGATFRLPEGDALKLFGPPLTLHQAIDGLH